MTSVHTPGPWDIRDATIWGPKGEEVATVSDERGPLHRVNGEIRKVGPKSIAIAEANLRLLAAAPTMLAALRDCIAALESDTETNQQAAALLNAQAAVAKAEGK